METKQPVTEEDINKLTIVALISLLKNFTLGAWILILTILSTLFVGGYKLGKYECTLQTLSNRQETSYEQLTFEQRLLLEEIWNYQKRNKFNKVIIGRDGFISNTTNLKKTDINLIEKVLGNQATQHQFEKLVFSIPASFLQQISESRLGSPYVVNIPEGARKRLDKHSR